MTVEPPPLLCADMKREKTLSAAHNWNDHHAVEEQSLGHIPLFFAREQSTEYCCRTPEVSQHPCPRITNVACLASDAKYARHCAKSLDSTRKMKPVRMLSLAETRVYHHTP